MSFSDILTPEDVSCKCEPLFDSPTVNYEGSQKAEDGDALSPTDNQLKTESCKIELPEFPIDRPWLPIPAVRIIDKLKKGPILEKELLTLMDIVAAQTIAHFQLQEGKFVALTYYGRIVEISETRIGLLKKIQDRKFTEEIFVWKVGSDTFSGRT
jgi:hypothetical protein